MPDSAENARQPAAPRMAAGVLFLDEQDRVMLVRPTYKPFWEIPGGCVEEGESPLQACVREVSEELGLHVSVTRLLTVDWAPHPDQGDKVLFVFDGGRLSADQLTAIAFQDGEIQQWAFVEDSRLDDFIIPRLARRVRASVLARRQLRPVYLEHGTSPAGQQTV